MRPFPDGLCRATWIMVALSLATSGAGWAADADTAWSTGYTLVELDVRADPLDAMRVIQAEGGTVALLLPPRYVTGWIPPAADAALLGRAGIRSIRRTAPPAVQAAADATEGRVQRFFARAVRGELGADVEARSEAAGPQRPDGWHRGDISEAEIESNLGRLGFAARKSGSEASLAANSDFMTGTVSVSLFFVESDGSGADPDRFDWTPAAEDDIFDDAAAALSWWSLQASKHSGCWVVFRVTAHFATEDPRCSQWREPVLHSSADYAGVIQQVLGNFGFAIGGHLSRAAAYDAAMRTQYETDWATSVFVAANPTGATQFADGYAAWAYLGGPYLAILQRSFSWPFEQVFAHEMGHIFRACDEYYTPGYGGCSGCGACGDTGVANGNCEECNTAPAGCMMRTNAWKLCSYTAGQVGWWRTPCTDRTLPAPRIDSVSPADVAQGEETDVEIHGDFFAAGVTVELGSGVEIVSLEHAGETLLRLRVHVDREAVPGERAVVVRGPDGQTDLAEHLFRVRGTPRHYVAPGGPGIFPFDRPERAAADPATALAACSAGDSLFLLAGTYPAFEVRHPITILGGFEVGFVGRALETSPSLVESPAGATAIRIESPGGPVVLDGLVLHGGQALLASTSQLGTLPAGGALMVYGAELELRGCRLEGGAAGSETTPGAGGGGFFWRSQVRLERCTVRGNRARRGGGLFFLDSEAVLEDVVVEANDALGGGSGAGVGALASRIELRGGQVTKNLGAQDGGGLHFEACPSVRLREVEVMGNLAARSGGGIRALDTPLDLVACRVTYNTAGERGGGIHATGSAIALESGLVAGNRAATTGGGLALEACGSSLLNVTLARNEGGPGSGAAWWGAPAAGVVRGSIVAENVFGGLLSSGGAPPLLDWNLFWQNGSFATAGLDAGEHDQVADPVFVAPDADDFGLGLYSPALDGGDPDAARRDPDGSRNDVGAHGGPRASPPAPARIGALEALEMNGEVRLHWQWSPTPDVTRYVVHRGAEAGFQPSAFTRIGEVAAPATAFVDPEPGSSPYYLVVAVDAEGHASGCPPAVHVSPLSDAEPPPAAFALRRIAPNPMNPGAWIEYDLPSPREARLEIYAATGARVRTLLRGPQSSGNHRLYWDGRDDSGRAVASGVYWVRLLSGSDHRTAKLTVLR